MDADSTPRPFLAPAEHRYLWLLSQGHTPAEAQRAMGIGRNPTLGTRLREKLASTTTAQALFKAAQLGLVGPHELCGTMRGYRRHHGVHEEACYACRRALAEFTDRTGSPSPFRPAQLTEAELRLLKALDAGRPVKAIARNWGCTTRTLDPVRASLYRKLDVAHLPWLERRPTALEEGRRQGLLRKEKFTAPGRPRRAPVTRLTDLEVATLRAVTEGRSLSQAGQLLGGIPGSSVSSKLARVYKKLDVLHHAHGERREAAIKEARNQGYPL